MTTQEAQHFLASQLPEKIIFSRWTYHDAGELLHIIWKNNHGLVRDTEWDYIARQVEAKLTEEQFRQYRDKLRKIYDSDTNRASSLVFTIWLIKLDYLTRAAAMKEVLETEGK
jgi:hypothetical protein